MMIRFNRLASIVKKAWARYKPIFVTPAPTATGLPQAHQFNYRRIWKTAILTAGGVAIVPLIIMTMVDYKVTQKAIASEFLLRAARIVSNTRRSIEFFLNERRSALSYIVRDNTMEDLLDTHRLQTVLVNLKRSFGGGFTDLGVIDVQGRQRTYVGPFDLKDKVYADQPWFRQVSEKGVFISDVFLGYRKFPHLVIAVKGHTPDGAAYILRASVGLEPFERLLADLEISGEGDAFIVNHEGILQTSSRYYGHLLQQVSINMPAYSDKTEVLEQRNAAGHLLVIGYRFLEETPFVLMVVKKKAELMAPWNSTRLELILFLAISLTIILSVILAMVTYMVSRIYEADQRRLAALHQVEYSNKLAAIGRMAAGIAHEINNPLAIINEKAGLIKDLFTFKKIYAEDQKLYSLIDSVSASVRRAGSITKRLLAFARNLEASRVEKLDLEEVTREVLSFVSKEAEHRGIVVDLQIPDNLPQIEVHRGKLQQVFLNIINNAMAAMNDGGELRFVVQNRNGDTVSIDIIDDGHGIAEDDLHRIFEPFFSTKTSRGGTGLGLSITYNLIQEIGGRIAVRSEVGKGTQFTIDLPVHFQPQKGEQDARVTGG